MVALVPSILKAVLGEGLRRAPPHFREVFRQKGPIRYLNCCGSQGLFSTARIMAHVARCKLATALRR